MKCNKKIINIVLINFIVALIALLFFLFVKKIIYLKVINPNQNSRNQIIETEQQILPTSVATPSAKQIQSEVEATRGITTGLSSYYSFEGCIGCNEKRIMANGEQLDDSKLTVAYNRAPLNSNVEVKNVKTGAVVVARVTDRGGFERHGKIIDLSVATTTAPVLTF